jgi:hypothetical protein
MRQTPRERPSIESGWLQIESENGLAEFAEASAPPATMRLSTEHNAQFAFARLTQGFDARKYGFRFN